MTDAAAPRRNLIVTGGIFHDFDKTAPMVAGILSADGIESEIVSGAEQGLARFAEGGFDLLTLHCLAWSMVQSEKYASYRDAHAYAIPDAMRAHLTDHLSRGGGLLGLHTASICFDGWRDWGRVLGAGWIWGRSHHPEPSEVVVAFADTDHPIIGAATGFALKDELYCDQFIAPDAVVLATGVNDAIAAPQPILTARTHGVGRAVYSALGHDAASFSMPAHRALVSRAARWACRLI